MDVLISLEKFEKKDLDSLDAVIARLKLSLRVALAKSDFIKPCEVKIYEKSGETYFSFLGQSEPVFHGRKPEKRIRNTKEPGGIRKECQGKTKKSGTRKKLVSLSES